MGPTAAPPTPVHLKHPATRLGRSVHSDEQLARMVHDGDPVAFSTIYERYRTPLSRYCRSILHQPDDAADAFQNTMMAALAGLERDVPSGPLRPWLYRVAHNESIDLMRRRKPNVELVAEIPARAEPTSDPEIGEQLQSLLGDLRVLPERQRGALLMRELAGLEYDQIGRSFDTSTVAARKLVYEARLTLGYMRDGRDASCALITRQISDGDGRTLRNRTVRAHIDSCASCAAFERSLHTRREQFALVPALPLAGGGIWLATTLGGGAGATKALAGGGAVAGGAVAGGSAIGAGAGVTAAGSAVSSFGGALAVKCLAVCGVLAVAGAGTAVVGTGASQRSRHSARGAALAAVPSTSSAAAHPTASQRAAAATASHGGAPTSASAQSAAVTAGTHAGPAAQSTWHATLLAGGSIHSGASHAIAGSTAGVTGTVVPGGTAGASSGTSTTPAQTSTTATATTTPSATSTTSSVSSSGLGTSGSGATGTGTPSLPGTSASASTNSGTGASASRTSSTSFSQAISQIIASSMKTATAAASSQADSYAGSVNSIIASALGSSNTAPSASGSSAPTGTTTTAQTTTTSSSSSPMSSLFSMFSGR